VPVLWHDATTTFGQSNKQRRLDCLRANAALLLSIVLDRFINERNSSGLSRLPGSPQLKLEVLEAAIGVEPMNKGFAKNSTRDRRSEVLPREGA